MLQKPKVVVILGATATGKSHCAISTLTRKEWNCGSKPSRSSLTLLKNAFIVTICFQTIISQYVASMPLHITRG